MNARTWPILLHRIPSTIALFALSFFFSASSAANPAIPMHFNHLSLQDGLSQNNVQSILQDSVGYMWFATESGLNRYDGYNIRRYSRERDNPNGFSNDFVWVIAEDSQQNLWLATQGGGVVRWNRATDSFDNFRHDPRDPHSLASNDIRTLLINDDGSIWVGTRDQGLDLLNPHTGHVRHFRHDAEDPRSLSNNKVYALHVDASEQLWVGTDRGVNRFDKDSATFVRFQNDPTDEGSLSDNRVRAILEDRSNTLWIGTSSGGLNRFDPANNRFARFRHDPADAATLSDDHVRVVFEDDGHRLWVGTADGLNLFDRATGTVNRYHDVAGDAQSQNDAYINSMYQDSSGLLWIGTRSAGVSRWNPRSWSLGHYDQPWLDDTDVTSFASNGNGELWIGTLGAGLARVNERTHALERYLHRPGDPTSISDDKVMSLLLDRDGILWVGTMTGGLNRIAPGSDSVLTYRHEENNPESIAADGVMSIYEDRDGQLWIGTYGGGVSVLNKDSGTFRHYSHDPGDPTSLSDQRASAILQDHTGSIWVGTFGGGLNLLDSDTGTFRRFNNDPYDPDSLADNMIYSLHLDGADNIWIGTAGGGLDRIIGVASENDQIRFQNFSQQDGLPSNVVYGVQSDSLNRIWLSTNYGLTRFDPASSRMKTFHRGHGLQGEEFNYAAHHGAADGKLYFGGGNGFNAYYPGKVEEGNFSPNIVLTSLQKMNRAAETTVPYDRMTRVELDYQDHAVNFSFAALDFTEPSQNTYSYMLEGFDDEWIDLGTKRHVTYTNLDGGRYILKVKAITSDGVPATGGFSLPIAVAAAPWETRGAYLSYALVLLTVLILVWQMQRRKFQREAEYSRRLEKDVELRTSQLEERNLELQIASRAKSDFLARMSHEIRTPMNGVLGMTQLLLGTSLEDKQFRFAQTIKRSAESLLDIINDILDFSKIEAGRLKLDQVEFSVSDLVDETMELLSGAACDKGVELICSAPPGESIAATGDPQRLKQVLVNLLGNAIKFTQDGEVVLRYTQQEDSSGNLQMRFEVTDTGVGIQEENLSLIFKSFSQEDGSTSRRFGGTGLGLAICKQLVEMMGGEIGVESEQGRGSCFWFTVKLQKASPAWLSRNVSFRLANLNVLVVDNNATNSDIVVNYLAALGVQAESAASGYEGLKHLDGAAQSTPFDLVIVDADLGDMTGITMAKVIKSNYRDQPAKIVLLKSTTGLLEDDEWRQVGIDDCLAKPIRQSMLYERLLVLTASTGTFVPRDGSREANLRQHEQLEGNVLLVEDNPVNQAVALGMLEELGCETVVAFNGLDALEHLAKATFDVVLMDCEMPVMDGFEATAEIRKKFGSEHEVPIIALTANAVAGDRERCLKAGMQDYLSKPICVEHLQAALKKYLPVKRAGGKTMGAIDTASLDSIRNLQGVGGDNMVKRVVDLYLSNSSMLVDDLRLALSTNDSESVRQSAHALKSSSQNVGAFGLASLSQKFEEMGRSGKLADIKGCMTELDDLYSNTVSALKAAIQQVRAC
ncbi:MAG: two-component regulator propeller domain-containing protein [Woeseiaceae bacterium]